MGDQLSSDISSILANIRIVLLGTTHPGNIGGSARAMKTMGLRHLVLVNPRLFPHHEATAMAASADDILSQAQVVGDLGGAIGDCCWVVGTSARSRSIPWPVVSPEAASRTLVQRAVLGRVAVLFGSEQSGLTNEELAHCHEHVHIPTDPLCSSLNLASSVQVMSYVLRRILFAHDRPIVPEPLRLATGDELEQFYKHLEAVLYKINFLEPQKSRSLLLRLRRLFHRARLENVEVNLLRGILKSVVEHSGVAGEL